MAAGIMIIFSDKIFVGGGFFNERGSWQSERLFMCINVNYNYEIYYQ